MLRFLKEVVKRRGSAYWISNHESIEAGTKYGPLLNDEDAWFEGLGITVCLNVCFHSEREGCQATRFQYPFYT